MSAPIPTASDFASLRVCGGLGDVVFSAQALQVVEAPSAAGFGERQDVVDGGGYPSAAGVFAERRGAEFGGACLAPPSGVRRVRAALEWLTALAGGAACDESAAASAWVWCGCRHQSSSSYAS